MSLSVIISATQTILSAVEGVGPNVYAYRRWTADDAGFQKLFTTNEEILAWTITREATKRERFEHGRYDLHTLVMRGWMGVRDAAATETTFQDLVEKIADCFEAAPGLVVDGFYAAEYSGPVDVRKVDYVKYGMYLCHYAELELVVKDNVPARAGTG